MEWSMVSRPDVGRCFPARTEPSAVVREIGYAAARLCFPARAAWSCAARRGRSWRGRLRVLVSRVVMHDRPNGFELWPRLQMDGRNFGRERNMRSSAGRSARFGRRFSIDRLWTVFAVLAISPFLLIQMRPFQLRWKVNSIRARRELVLMKSIE
ncbi:unnamed protein product [Microthlaspi erraticum]|uniref:Uncharacterized protein n=1 Tax=Microthlaspi erraticum TaxID=1685480 RepID=A0A6D2LA94_9BRAS|nr:unnamed protein product [Microthlaspi erraticum]